jgi:hypothetical protein
MLFHSVREGLLMMEREKKKEKERLRKQGS